MCLDSESRAALDVVLDEFFVFDGENYFNARADREIAAYQKMADGGKKGAEARWAKARTKPNDAPPIAPTCPPHAKGNANHEPITNNHKPLTINHEPTKVKTVSATPAGLSANAQTWASYSTAYVARYGVEPVRNATVNSQIASFVKRIGVEESPLVAAWYVASNTAYRVKSKHSVGCMLQDAEGLRTEWATNSTVTSTKAFQADRTQAIGDVFRKLIAEEENVQKIA